MENWLTKWDCLIIALWTKLWAVAHGSVNSMFSFPYLLPCVWPSIAVQPKMSQCSIITDTPLCPHENQRPVSGAEVREHSRTFQLSRRARCVFRAGGCRKIPEIPSLESDLKSKSSLVYSVQVRCWAGLVWGVQVWVQKSVGLGTEGNRRRPSCEARVGFR